MTDDQTNGQGHNSEAIKDAIQRADAELRPHEEQIAEHRAAMKTIKQNFKAETGMTIEDLNAARRLAQMEDESDRSRKLGNFMTIYNALVPGEQMDWVEAATQT